jgi:hypothetical protein
MRNFKFALAALAMVAGVGAYATNQNAKDPQLTQGYVSANCAVTGNITCGSGDGLAAEQVEQRSQNGIPVITDADHFVSRN